MSKKSEEKVVLQVVKELGLIGGARELKGAMLNKVLFNI